MYVSSKTLCPKAIFGYFRLIAMIVIRFINDGILKEHYGKLSRKNYNGLKNLLHVFEHVADFPKGGH